MRQGVVTLRMAAQRGEVPVLVRFLGKLVLEVLPAALASVIGAFLFAHYQFGQPEAARSAAAPVEALPASAAMMRMLHEEHAMVRNLLMAQQSAEEKRIAAADSADARAADPKLADTDVRRALLAEIAARPEVAARPQSKRSKPARSANGASAGSPASAAAAELPPVVIASAAPDPALLPPPRPSLVSRTLAVPGRVVAVTLHAVMAIGGIPSWIGHQVGATDLDSEAPHGDTAS